MALSPASGSVPASWFSWTEKSVRLPDMPLSPSAGNVPLKYKQLRVNSTLGDKKTRKRKEFPTKTIIAQL
eukprot:1324923-Amphidinium_carterae.1